MKKKFYIALVVTVLAVIVFILTNFTPYFRGNKMADFMQGFSGGLAAGALIATLSWGVQWKREKDAQASVQ
ncbi:hypothetical protein [Mucilaginibacter gilvus]|uniref:Uncharacterized protein n=1 Tax=Mucilaginibacter gilvus TaxID=2305909 RepID=A0A444MK78_9SPHI|nr:hypothetical protein [Mucilaginibacter gilvus]RWY49278.1 hypothetical protein EPL05_17870 [Mucilaginibacter gilvus]